MDRVPQGSQLLAPITGDFNGPICQCLSCSHWTVVGVSLHRCPLKPTGIPSSVVLRPLCRDETVGKVNVCALP